MVIWSNTEKKVLGKAELPLLYKKKLKIKALGPSTVKIRELSFDSPPAVNYR